MKLNYAQKILIMSIAAFVVILALDIISSGLLIKKIVNINNKIKQQNISTQERERALSLKESVINSLEERTKLGKYFVGSTDAQTADFISAIEILTKKVNLTSNIKSVSYEPTTEIISLPNISFIRLKINVSGKWDDVFTFVRTIESLPRIVVINSISMNNSSKLWSADIDISVAKLNN